jgi:hypothetical protein
VIARKKSKAGRKPLAAEPIDVMSLRLPRSLKLALDECAADDARPSSMKLRLILAEWLKAAGYLK